MSKAKTVWLESKDGTLLEVPEFPELKESLFIHAARDDGETGDAYVDAAKLRRRAKAEDGWWLCHTGGGGGSWCIVKPPCGAEGDCGCGCDHGWTITVLSDDRAAVWAQNHGIPLERMPEGLRDAFTSMVV